MLSLFILVQKLQCSFAHENMKKSLKTVLYTAGVLGVPELGLEKRTEREIDNLLLRAPLNLKSYLRVLIIISSYFLNHTVQWNVGHGLWKWNLSTN